MAKISSDELPLIALKFKYSEKATNCCEISTVDLSYVSSNGPSHYMLLLDLAWNYKSVLTQFSTGQRTLWLKNLQISHVTLLKRSPLLFIPFNLRCTKGSCWYRFLWFRQMMLGAKISPIFIQEVRRNTLQVNDFQKVYFGHHFIKAFDWKLYLTVLVCRKIYQIFR